MRDFILAIAVFATVAISAAVDEECIQRKMRALPVHWPNPTDCASFYRCTNKNIKRQLVCPEGKIYNSKTGRCTLKGRSVCRLSLAAPLAKAVNNTCYGKLSGTFFPDSSSCRDFFICNDNLSYPQTCELGSYFNTTILGCVPDKKIVCWENLCVNQTNGVSLPDAKNCHRFHICNEQKPITQNCSVGSYFNVEDRNCQPGRCPGEDTTTTTTTEPITTTTTAPETTTPGTTTSATTTCAAVTTTTTICSTTRTTTCAPETKTTTCTPETKTTTCTPETKTTTCAPETKTTTCAAETTTTTCAPETTTTTCAPETTTTTCAPEKTTTTCTTKSATTTCSPQENTTPADAADCSNDKCDSSKCLNDRYGLVFPAHNTNAGFCRCVNQKAKYHECPDESVFNESLLFCVAQDKVCPSSKCWNEPNNTTFPATNTTTGFCTCIEGQATFSECVDSNSVYNSTLGICVNINNSSDCDTTKLCKGGRKAGDFVRNLDNCMLFYICYEGDLVEVSCEAGNYFDDNIKACFPDTEKKCPDCQIDSVIYTSSRRNKRSITVSNCVEGSKTPAADCDKYYKCSSGHKLLYGCGKDSFFNITTLACQLDVEHVCTSCTDGEKIPNPADNTKYYECVRGKLKSVSCGVSSYFNKLKKACVDKQECTCPGGYKDGEISPHPTDCDKFYVCINSEQILHECGKGNYFDKKSQSCQKDTKNTCNVEKPCSCPGGYEEGQLSSHPRECHKYYICEDGQQILQDCGNGNYFDNSTLKCKPDIYHECWDSEECTCPGGYEEGDFSAHPKDCNKYYICNDGQQMLQDCGTNNYFNNATLMCERDRYHVCWPNLCAGQPNGALVANPQQCNTFFLCSNNEPTAKACFEGQWFDPSISACVADVKAVCYNPCANETASSVILLPHPICNEYYFCNGHKTFVGTCTVGSFDIETGVCNDAKKCYPNPCDDPSVVVYPDAFDPAKFYWCNKDKQPIPYNCPTGMVFDGEFKICKKVSDPDCTVCTKDGAFHTLNATNDSEFCVCVDGLATRMECPADYAFNSELGICYSNAPCDPSFCLDVEEYDTAPNRNDSKSFCMCFNKKSIIIDCPNNGTFNPYILQCSDYEISPECLQSTCIGDTTNTRVFKPINTKTSNGFCHCVSQIATFRPCNYGSTFNPDLLICQLQEINCNSYQCRNLPENAIIPSVTSTEGYCECIAGVATYHNCPNNGQFNVTTNKCGAPLCDLKQCTDNSSLIPFPASVPNGFCMCKTGFIPCQAEGTLFSEIYGNCMEPCPQMICTGKPDKYLVSSVINKYSFCVCHTSGKTSTTFEDCPSASFVFKESEQMCVPNVEKLCGTDTCKTPDAYGAKDTLTGFCLCTAKGTKPIFQKCMEGIFVPSKKACLPMAEDVCDIRLCAEATIAHPITLPANNSILDFCYCSSPTNAMLLSCPSGKYYKPAKAMCVSEAEDNCACPNNIAEGQKVPDAAACNKYSECVKGVMESHTCSNGDYFNVEVNCCVPDTEGVCHRKSDCKCLGIYYENERVPHPINPQMYYTCQGNALHEYKCPIGRFFSDTQKQCVTNTNLRQKRSADLNNDYEYGCLENEKRSVPSNCSQYEICLQQTWVRKICSKNRYYNPEQRICLEPRDDFVCSYAKVTTLPTCNASMEYRLLKAKTCQHYYRCQTGKWHLKTCGRQQYFNTKLLSCLPVPDDPFFKCDLSLNISNNNNEEIETCHHLSQRFYVKNCAMYLICLDKDWWYQYCPTDMYYNRTLNYCLKDINLQCQDVVQSKAIVNDAEFFQVSCQQDGFLRPSAMACNRYFVCVNGKWQIQHCSVGEFYDVTHAKCSMDTEGLCAQLNKDCLPNDRRPVAHNCSSYEECSKEGKWVEKTCPPYEIFDGLLQQCTTNEGICSEHGLKRTCRESETKVVKQNCSMLYYCSQDTWALGSCLKGFMYSSERQMCFPHALNDTCKPLILKETLSNGTSYREKNVCEGKLDGSSVAHPFDCSRYYICIQQSSTHQIQCPRASYFDSSVGYCRPNDGSCRLPLKGACVNATDNSLVEHSSDCQAFYSCSSINGTELLYCPNDQYFDKNTHQCRIDRGECKKDIFSSQQCSNAQHGTRLAHETFCNIYYVCIKSLAFPAECPDNLHFSNLSSKCISTKKHQCQLGHLEEHNITSSCANLSDGTYLPDLRDCTRYFICSQGQPVPKKCANTSYFDNEQLLCVPDDGYCPYVNKDEQKANKPKPPNPAICEGKHGHLLSDPLNCNNFYACIHNKLKHERCYSQQFFNTTSQQCQQITLQESERNVNATLKDLHSNTSKNTISHCADATTSLKLLCSEMIESTSLAEPGDCRRYIACQDLDDEPISKRCRNGERFDSLLGFCRQNDGTCLMENGQRVGECSGKHGQLARDPSNCRNYFVCINGQQILQTCEQDEYFSKSENMCTKDMQQVCKPKHPTSEEHTTQSCDGLSEFVLYPYVRDNCRSYFQCYNGVAKVHKCADDLYFDPLTVKCVKNKTDCLMPTQNLQRTPAFKQTYNKLCSNKDLEYPYANVENDCRSFYLCHANGDVTHMWCPLGMLFSKELLICSGDYKTRCN